MTCPNAFADTQTQVYFVCVVAFLVVYLAIAIALCLVRPEVRAGKKLLGAAYIIALCFIIA